MSALVKFLSTQRKDGETLKKLGLHLATAIGIWGGFPRVPKLIQRALEPEWMQYVMVTLLIYQGSGNFQLAVELALLFYVIHKALEELDRKLESEEEFFPGMAPPR